VLVAGAGDGGFKTTIRWQPEWRPRIDRNWLNGEISTTGKLGGTNLTLSLKNEARRQGHWGPERRFDGNGDLLFVRDEFGRDGDGDAIGVTRRRHCERSEAIQSGFAPPLDCRAPGSSPGFLAMTRAIISRSDNNARAR